MREKTCSFTGHRKIKKEEVRNIEEILYKEIINLINKGYVFFISGGALGFDTISALTILKLQKIYPYIKLILALPCKEQDKYWGKKDIDIYNFIKSKFNKLIYVSEKYTKDCMFKRNKYLINNSSTCIAYLKNNKGGTFYTVNYAKSNNLNIINIAEKFKKLL